VPEEGTRLTFFELDSIVIAARRGNSLFLMDQHQANLIIPGTEGGLLRLLAEILTRVPWALNHFEPEVEKSWTENPQRVITEVQERRGQVLAPRKEIAEEQHDL
jgi:hypothetical protein